MYFTNELFCEIKYSANIFSAQMFLVCKRDQLHVRGHILKVCYNEDVMVHYNVNNGHC